MQFYKKSLNFVLGVQIAVTTLKFLAITKRGSLSRPCDATSLFSKLEVYQDVKGTHRMILPIVFFLFSRSRYFLRRGCLNSLKGNRI